MTHRVTLTPRRILCYIAFFSFSSAVLVGVGLISRFIPPAAPNAEDITVPDLLGSLYDPEDGRLPADLFDVTVDYLVDDQALVGTILAQTPMSGAVRRVIPGQQRCPMQVTVCAAAPLVTMPNFIGTNAEIAAQQLNALGLRVLRRTEVNDRVSLGRVLQTEPTAGEQVRIGDAVTLVVSTVKTQRTLRVPHVVGAPCEMARLALKRAGIALESVIYVPSDLPRDTVLTQFPLSRTTITASQATATLTVSDGSLAQPPKTEEE